MPHLHSALGFNFSAGMTLTPAAYRDLFAPRHPRLFRDSDLLNDILGHTAVDLSRDVTPEQAGDEPSITLLASRDAAVFRAQPLPDPARAHRRAAGEPALPRRAARRDRDADADLSRRRSTRRSSAASAATFPTRGRSRPICAVRSEPEQFGPAYADLRRRRVLLDAPPRYL